MGISCDHGQSFEVLATLPSYGEGAAPETQLLRTADGVLVTPAGDTIELSCDLGQSWTSIPAESGGPVNAFDVALHPDGSVWVAGAPHSLWRLRESIKKRGQPEAMLPPA